MEPIIIKSTHRFLFTRRAKIRSKRDESDGTDPTTIQPSYLCAKWQFLKNHTIKEQKQEKKRKLTIENQKCFVYP